jgi:hypothetical protein
MENRESLSAPYYDVMHSTSTGRRAILWHNACSDAVIVYAGILAYLLQGMKQSLGV